jgi:hypothetical protein
VDTISPGWFPDPAGAPVERWWDGARWTPYTQPLGYAQFQQQTVRSARATGTLARLVLWGVGIVVAVVVLVFVLAYVSIATH